MVCTCTSANGLGPERHRDNLAVRLLDIAASGACLVTTGRLPVTAPVILDVTVPRLEGRLQTRAEVRWSVTLEKGGRTAHVAGLRFDRVLDAFGDRRQLPRAVPEEHSGTSREPQRRWKRFSPRVASLSCDPHDLRRMLGFKSNPALSLRDLSRGGARIVTSRKLKKGSRADLALELPSVSGALLIETQVRWCRRDTLSLEPRWNTGLVFIRMSKEDEGRLKHAEQFHTGPNIWG
jgi:hypothetical protein